MNRPGQDQNRDNQCNPNHKQTGPGHPAAYQGSRDKANIDNHAQQLNPNNEKFVPRK